jgi:hypothetical protein
MNCPGQVHLVPVNEQCPPHSYPESPCRWAIKLLAILRRKA